MVGILFLIWKEAAHPGAEKQIVKAIEHFTSIDAFKNILFLSVFYFRLGYAKYFKIKKQSRAS